MMGPHFFAGNRRKSLTRGEKCAARFRSLRELDAKARPCDESISPIRESQGGTS